MTELVLKEEVYEIVGAAMGGVIIDLDVAS